MSRAAILKLLDATLGFFSCWILGYMHFILRRRPAPPGEIGRKPERILIIRPGGIGDMVLLLPVINRIRREFPGAELDLVCERRNLDVLRMANLAGNAIPYDSSPFLLLRRLLTKRYDIAIDTEQFHHLSAVLAFLSRAPVRIGFKINPSRNLLYTHLVNYAMDAYEGTQFMRLLGPLHLDDGEYRLEGVLSGATLQGPVRLGPLKTARPFIALCPGSTTAYKHWEESKYSQLIRILNEERGLGVVLVGGREARRAVASIMKQSPGSAANIHSVVGELSLAETAALLKEARLFVGGDSGLGHLAVALGVSTVILFGPSDHVKWGISDARHAVVRKPIACSPCFIFGYHRLCRTIACMSEIQVDDVVAACDRVLNSGASVTVPIPSSCPAR